MAFVKRYPLEAYPDVCILSRKLVADHVKETPADTSMCAVLLWEKVRKTLKIKGLALPKEVPARPEQVYVGEQVRFTWKDWTGVAPKKFNKSPYEPWLIYEEAAKVVKKLAKRHKLLPPTHTNSETAYQELRTLYNPASGRGPKLKYVPSSRRQLKEAYQGKGWTTLSSFIWGKEVMAKLAAKPRKGPKGPSRAQRAAAAALHEANPHPQCRKHSGLGGERCQCGTLKRNDEKGGNGESRAIARERMRQHSCNTVLA